MRARHEADVGDRAAHSCKHDSKRSMCRAWVFCKHLLVQWKKLHVLGVWWALGTRWLLIFRQSGRNYFSVASPNKAGAFPPIVICVLCGKVEAGLHITQEGKPQQPACPPNLYPSTEGASPPLQVQPAKGEWESRKMSQQEGPRQKMSQE